MTPPVENPQLNTRPSQTNRLLLLPAELRINIYEYAFLSILPNLDDPSLDEVKYVTDPIWHDQFRKMKQTYYRCLDLTQTCRQIRNEAQPILAKMLQEHLPIALARAEKARISAGEHCYFTQRYVNLLVVYRIRIRLGEWTKWVNGKRAILPLPSRR
jgi:hypothetical protein